MAKSHYLLSLVLSRLATLTLEVVVIIGFAWIAFDVAVHGSLWALAALALLGALAFGGLGLLRGQPRAHHRSGVGPDEPGDAADVGAVGRVLRVDEFSRSDAAVHSRAAADGAERRAAHRSSTRADRFDAVLPQVAILAAWGGISFVLSLKLFRWQ